MQKILFYALVSAVIVYGQFFVNGDLVTGVPPEIAPTTISGESVDEQISAGPGLIYFWSEWCGICRTMTASVDEIFKDYPGVSVALQSGNAEKVLQYQQQQQLGWKTVADENGSIGARYGIRGVPAVFILDKQGKIKYTLVGYSSETGIRLRLWLAGLY